MVRIYPMFLWPWISSDMENGKDGMAIVGHTSVLPNICSLVLVCVDTT